MRAVWNGVTLAESDDTVEVEGNAYFPRESLNTDHFVDSQHTSVCPWKGTANYLTVTIDGQRNENAAWYYAEPKAAAKQIRGRVAFWKGIRVET